LFKKGINVPEKFSISDVDIVGENVMSEEVEEGEDEWEG
jgi:hypothetical protein